MSDGHHDATAQPRASRHGDPMSVGPAPGEQPFAALSPEDARAYDGWYGLPEGRAVAAEEEQTLAGLLRRFPARQTVLEIGSGTGHFARWLAGQGHTVYGVDVAPGMLAVAAEHGGGPGYVRAVAEALPFRDGSVDLALFVTSLEFTQDPARALREAARVSRHGLLLGVLNLASPMGLGRKLAARFRPSPFGVARFRTPWGLRRELRAALGRDLRVLRIETALWPRWVPAPLRRLPLGGFIGAAVRLTERRGA